MRDGNGETFERSNIGGKGMPRCVECGKENWGPLVYEGKCAWCGYDANNPKEEAEKCAL